MQGNMQEQADRQQRAEHIEALIQAVASFADPHARAVSEELLQMILAMYGEGLARALGIIAADGEVGLPLLNALGEVDVVGSLLLLHGLHPVKVETRIARALDEIRPYLKKQGGNVEVLKVLDGVVYLRLEGNGSGCSSSMITLQQTIEETIYRAAPDIISIQADGAATAGRQPLIGIPTRRTKAGASSVPTL